MAYTFTVDFLMHISILAGMNKSRNILEDNFSLIDLAATQIEMTKTLKFCMKMKDGKVRISVRGNQRELKIYFL